MGRKHDVYQDIQIRFTDHAERRMCGRRINAEKVQMVIDYGRYRHEKKADIFIVGKKEVMAYRQQGIDLRDLEGIQVVAHFEENGIVVRTVYRNRDFRHSRDH